MFRLLPISSPPVLVAGCVWSSICINMSYEGSHTPRHQAVVPSVCRPPLVLQASSSSATPPSPYEFLAEWREWLTNPEHETATVGESC